MSKQVFIKHVVRTKNSLNFTAFIQECYFLLLVFQLIMELDCESELTPLLSTRLKEPIHSGAKFFLKVKFVVLTLVISLNPKYSDLPNNRAASLILFWKKIHLHSTHPY